MIANLEATTQRTTTDMLTPDQMVEMMRGGYSIGIPLEDVDHVVSHIRPLLEADERIAYQQSCDTLMDIYIFKKEKN